MDAASPARFLKLYAGLTLGILLGIVAINVVVDPLWVYHRPWLPQRFVKDQRQANPGIARFGTYDSVVIGNSLTENLLASDIELHLGWRPLKLCVSGSTPLEQRLVLNQALLTGQVRDVLWSIDLFSLAFGPDEVRFADFPFHLYDRGVMTFWKYLMSGSTLVNSFKVVFGLGPRDLEARHLWSSNTIYGRDPVLEKWRHTFAKRDFLPANKDLAWQSVEKHLFEVVRSHPEIRFHFMLPPYSALYRVSELVAPDNPFATRMRFKRELSQSLLKFPNVEVFDFETADELTHDIDRYMDLIHYDLPACRSIIRWIANGQYRLTPDSIDDRIKQLENDTCDYAKTVFAPGNPFRDQLQIEEFGLRLPAAIESAVPGASSSPPRMAEGVTSSKN